MFGKRNNDFDEKRVKALQQQLYMYASDLQKNSFFIYANAIHVYG